MRHATAVHIPRLAVSGVLAAKGQPAIGVSGAPVRVMCLLVAVRMLWLAVVFLCVLTYTRAVCMCMFVMVGCG
mgnify:CR=1 FL=1